MVGEPREDCAGLVEPILHGTHHKALEQDPALAIRILETLLSAAPVGFVFLDRDLRFVCINDHLADINGLPAAAHLGRTVAEIAPTLEATLHEVTARILATGQPVIDYEFTGETLRRPGVTQIWNESWYPVRGERGEIIGFGGVVVETTERRQSEAALRLANERFQLAVKASKAVLWQQDLDLRFTWLHNTAPGIDGSDAVGKREADLLERADDVAVIEGLKREVIRSGTGMRHEFSPQIQGVVHCFDLLMEPLRDAAGRITGITGAAIDITERKRLEEARRNAEQDFQALAKAGSEVPYRMSADWSMMQRLDGQGVFESSDCKLPDWAWMDEYLPREEHARVREMVNDAIARLNLFEMEHRALRPDGSTFWVRSRAAPIFDDSGGLVAWFGTATDINDRKRAEAAQRQTEQYYKALTEASSEIPYRMSADWSTMQPLDGRKLVASSDQPLVDWAWLDQNIPLDEHARVRQAISDAIAQRKLFEMEHRVLRPDGSIGWALSRAVPILDENENLVAWFGVASNINERKRIEQELIDTTAVADKANRAKSEFLSRMSHELRTPLHAILGFGQLIEAEFPPSSPAQKRNIDHILEAGWYLLALVDEILELSVIESGTLALSLEAVSLGNVMRECQALVETQAQKSGIRMAFPRFDDPCYINADPTRVKQILSNLLSNAIKYNGVNGSVVVDWRASAAGRIRISIEDTGNGLSPSELAQLFQPFNRLGKEATSVPGTGIGLVLSKRLIEMMGGTIGVESTVGKGSVFWIELNLTTAPSRVTGAKCAATVPLAPDQIDKSLRTLLYVEDNPMNLALVEKILLSRPDIRLLTAIDGETGIEIARAVLPDVILMDINLPGISGIETTKFLAEDPATARIPVVALSANAIRKDIETGLKIGFFRYVTKPIKIHEFLDALDTAFEFSKSGTSRTTKKEQQ